jgi:hypothetical protein
MKLVCAHKLTSIDLCEALKCAIKRHTPSDFASKNLTDMISANNKDAQILSSAGQHRHCLALVMLCNHLAARAVSSSLPGLWLPNQDLIDGTISLDLEEMKLQVVHMQRPKFQDHKCKNFCTNLQAAHVASNSASLAGNWLIFPKKDNNH